jgi:hypothetical protein
MSDEQDDLELLRRARALDRDVEPRRDLWPEIHAELAATVAPGRRWVAPLALAASLLVGVTALTMLWQSPGPEVVNDPVVPVGLDPALVQTRADLLVSLDAELERMSPESRAAVAESLQDIDRALAAIHAELEDHPNSELLLGLLVSTYTDQILLLGEMDGMARTIGERTEL